ncbi:hypothetical protein KA005_74485 [bacterium]|nr:hypothetical protein [bacterium]
MKKLLSRVRCKVCEGIFPVSDFKRDGYSPKILVCPWCGAGNASLIGVRDLALIQKVLDKPF